MNRKYIKNRLVCMCAVMAIAMLSACGNQNVKNENDVSAAGSAITATEGETQSDAGKPKADGDAVTDSKEYTLINDEYNVFLVNGDDVVKIYDAYEENDTVPHVDEAQIIGDYVYIVFSLFDDDSHVLVYDFEGNMYDDISIPMDYSLVKVEGYQGKVYISYNDYIYSDEGSHTACNVLEYIPKTKSVTNNSEYSSVMTMIANSSYSYIHGSNSYFESLNEQGALYVMDFDTRELVKLDESGNSLVRYTLEGDRPYVIGAFSHYVLTEDQNYEIGDEATERLYDIDTQKTIELYKGDPSALWNYAGGDDKYLYYYVTDLSSYNYNFSKVNMKRYDIEAGESQDLYECNKLPGRNSYYMNPGVTGFKIAKDKIYYAYYSQQDAVFYEYDINENTSKETEALLHHFESFEYATIISESETYDYPGYEGHPCYYFYDEVVTINDSVKNAAAINEELKKANEAIREQAEKEKDDMMQREYEPEWNVYSSLERTVSNIKMIGSKHLLVAMNEYWYGGGAHGMSYHSYYLFDLDTGKEVTAADLSSLSEDEFKKKVAQATIEDWKNSEDKYFNSYIDNPDSEGDFYQELYDHASKDMLMAWDDDGIIIEYEPYLYGSYATGYICIPISYDEIGIQMK